MGRIYALLAFALACLALASSAASAQPYSSSWRAVDGVFPSDVCWTLVSNSAVPPALDATKLTLSTTNIAQNEFYDQGAAALSLPTLWIIEARCRRVSGSTTSSLRAPISIQFQRSASQVNLLSIGNGEIFLLASDAARGATATVPTSDAMHTYRIEVNGTAIQVFYDGVLTLAGSLYASSGVAAGARIFWGEGSSLVWACRSGRPSRTTAARTPAV